MQRRFTRNSGRRPGKQWLPQAITPLRLNVQTPITPPGATVVQIVASEYGCRVTPESNQPGDIVLSAWWDGIWQHKEPFEIIYDGEEGEGSLIKVTFVGEYDSSKIWELRIRAGWKVVESRRGGIPGGLLSLAVGQPQSVGGWLVVSSAEEGGGNPPPLLYWLDNVSTEPSGEVVLTFDGAMNGLAGKTDMPEVIINGVLAASWVWDANNLVLTPQSPVFPGTVVFYTAQPAQWSATSDGRLLAPFVGRL